MSAHGRVAAVVLALGVVLGVQGCTSLPLSTWTQALGGPGQSSSNPGEAALTARTVGTLHRTWSSQVGVSAAVVDGDQLFTTDGGPDQLVLVDRVLATGALRWRHALAPGAGRLAADGAGRVVYAVSFGSDSSGGNGGDLTAVDQATGRTLWTQPRRTLGVSSPTFGGGRLFIERPAGMTTALDPSGRTLWTAPMTGGGGAWSAGRFYTAGVVLDAATGARLWRYDEQPAFLSGGDVVSGTRMIVGGANGVGNVKDQGAFAWYSTAGCGRAVCTWSRAVPTSSRQYLPMVAQADTVLAWTPVGVQAWSLLTGRLVWQETSDSDLLRSWIAGDLAWTVDQTATLRAFRLAGCGSATCAPVAVLPPVAGSAMDHGLTARGVVLTWGLSGMSAAAAR